MSKFSIPYVVKNTSENVSISKKDKSSTDLSFREIEILVLICEELSPSEISGKLYISEKTFFNHRSNILLKVGAKGNIGLLKYAYQMGIIELPK